MWGVASVSLHCQTVEAFFSFFSAFFRVRQWRSDDFEGPCVELLGAPFVIALLQVFRSLILIIELPHILQISQEIHRAALLIISNFLLDFMLSNQINLYYGLSFSQLILLLNHSIILAPLCYTIIIGDKDIKAWQATTMNSIYTLTFATFPFCFFFVQQAP